MATKIFKYELCLCGDHDVSCKLPVGAKILKIAFQGNALMLWAIVDADAYENECRYFRVVGTGGFIGEDIKTGKFIDTAFHGQYVWHVFEVGI